MGWASLTFPMGLSEAWVGAIAALGGVAITGLIALGTAILTHRWTAEATREAWATKARAKHGEIRRAAYARFLAAADNIRDAAEFAVDDESVEHEAAYSWYRANPQLLREAQTASGEARIVASDDVFEAINGYEDALSAYLGDLFEKNSESADDTDSLAAEEALVLAMRREQAADLTPQADPV